MEKTFYTDFVNYLVIILRIKLFQKDFGKTVVKLPVKSNAGCTLSPSAFGESVTLYTLAKSSQFWCATRGDSQARHDTHWLVHQGPLKKRDLNKARHERRGYTRGSEVRRVFPSTFSLLPCLGFPRWECTASVRETVKAI